MECYLVGGREMMLAGWKVEWSVLVMDKKLVGVMVDCLGEQMAAQKAGKLVVKLDELLAEWLAVVSVAMTVDY